MDYCPICNSYLTNNFEVNGPDIVYINNLSNGKSNISFCLKCDLGVNKAYKPFDFAKLNYSNIDPNFIQPDDDEIIYLQFKKYLNKVSTSQVKEKLCCIEIGAGKKLSLLSKIAKNDNFDTYAIDPIYKNLNKIENIKLINDISCLDNSLKISIFIARNCLEYFSPDYLISNFFSRFSNKALIFIELQSFDYKKWGRTFLFREYNYFYRRKSIERLLAKSGFTIDWLSSYSIFGDERKTFAAFVSKNQSSIRKTYYDNIYDLTRDLKIFLNKKEIILWGAGGRGLHFLYNEGKGLVHKVVDSSVNRQGIALDGYGVVQAPDFSTKDAIIILLNNRFIEYLPLEVLEKNELFLIA